MKLFWFFYLELLECFLYIALTVVFYSIYHLIILEVTVEDFLQFISHIEFHI